MRRPCAAAYAASVSLRKPAIAFALLGSLAWIGSTACVIYRPVVTRPPTLGDELISLDESRKNGLLTQQEYDKRRAETIALWKEIGKTPIVNSHEPPAAPAVRAAPDAPIPPAATEQFAPVTPAPEEPK